MAPISEHWSVLEATNRFSSILQSRGHLAVTLSSSLNPQRLVRRTTSENTVWSPGQGAKPPQEINNKAFFSLFAILGAAMVVASIWFFFWAKNGGFVWRENDWEDYKSTVLRRKGPDGKTLSNATKSTKLGGRSIAGTFTDYDHREKIEPSEYAYPNSKQKQKKTRPHAAKGRLPSDDDVRAYRHEKPALVGGLNRQHDGSHFDYTNSDRSEMTSNLSQQPLRPKPVPPKKKGFMEKKRDERRERKHEKEQKKAKAKNGRKEEILLERRSSTVATSTIADTEETYESDKDKKDESYYAAYRPPTAPYASRHSSPRRESPYHSRPSSANHPRQPSPTKHASRHHNGYAYSEAGSSDTGTKVYSHHIPEVGRHKKDTGYRRDAFGGGRDSLSDSDSDGDLGSRRY